MDIVVLVQVVAHWCTDIKVWGLNPRMFVIVIAYEQLLAKLMNWSTVVFRPMVALKVI